MVSQILVLYQTSWPRRFPVIHHIPFHTNLQRLLERLGSSLCTVFIVGDWDDSEGSPIPLTLTVFRLLVRQWGDRRRESQLRLPLLSLDASPSLHDASWKLDCVVHILEAH